MSCDPIWLVVYGQLLTDYICHGTQTWVVDLGQKEQWISFISFISVSDRWFREGSFISLRTFLSKRSVVFIQDHIILMICNSVVLYNIMFSLVLQEPGLGLVRTRIALLQLFLAICSSGACGVWWSVTWLSCMREVAGSFIDRSKNTDKDVVLFLL
jgi:hypothetical protein